MQRPCSGPSSLRNLWSWRASAEIDSRFHLPEDCADGAAKGFLVFGLEAPEAADDEGRVDGGDDGFDDRRFDEAGRLPVGDLHFTEGGGGPCLAGYCHDDQIAPATVIRGA